ncbi:MAG: glycosyltransferase family 4 protein, partial [Proteobacteria bacterium]|nr:glycosyltransferase family 4 protein [Pseudomonadota bacterium]
NTFEGNRRSLLVETFREMVKLDKNVILVSGYVKDLPTYLGAADLALFPTDGSPSELACISIRVMTYLNYLLPIATDDSPSEWHKTLKDCLIMGKTPQEIAYKSHFFLKNPLSIKKLKEKMSEHREKLDWKVLKSELNEYYRRIS